MVRYPHTLFVLSQAESQELSNGDYVPGIADYVPLGPCRDSVAGKSDSITLEDGTVTVLQTLIFAPLSTPVLFDNDLLQVRDEAGRVRVSGTVKRVFVSQLNVRIWL